MDKLLVKVTVDGDSETKLYKALLLLPPRKRARYLLARARLAEELASGAPVQLAPNIKEQASRTEHFGRSPLLAPQDSLGDTDMSQLMESAFQMSASEA